MPLQLNNASFAYPPRLKKRIGAAPINTGLVAPLDWHNGGGSDFASIANTPKVQSQAGLVWTNTASTHLIRAKMNKPFMLGTDPYITLVLVFRTITASNAAICGFGAETGAAGNTLAVLRPLTGDNSKLNFLIQDASANLVVSTNSGGAVAINDGLWHCAVATARLTSSGAANAIYIDGQVDGTGTRGASMAATTYQTICAFGNRRAATDFPTGGVYEIVMVVPIFGLLQDNVAKSLSANPWQLLEQPARRKLFGVTAAATFNAAWNVAANTVITTGARAA